LSREGGAMGRDRQGAGRSADGRNGHAPAGPVPARRGPAAGVEGEGVEPGPGRVGAVPGGGDHAGGGQAAAARGARVPLPVCLIQAPTGTGKTEATARYVAREGSTCWLADRHEDVEAAVAAIERHGGQVGRVLPLEEYCLHADTVSWWQAKGYMYRV